MTFKPGDLVIIEDMTEFEKSVGDFRDKWTTTATALGTVTAMEVATVTARNKQTDQKVEVKYCGRGWKRLPDTLTATVIDIRKEEHSDLDVIQMYDQEGTMRYCRRLILERFKI